MRGQNSGEQVVPHRPLRFAAAARRDALGTALLFAPGFVIYLAFMVLPIMLSLYYSFFDWDGIRSTMNFVGLKNYLRGLNDRHFHNALRITFFFTIPGALLGNALGLFLAVLVNRPGPMTNVYRAAFFFPLLISSVAVGFIWKALLSYHGILGGLFAAAGMEPIDWLGDPQLAPWSVLIVNLWRDTGFVTVIYLAGLQAVPGDLYDAATIDGASAWQRFRAVTFPWLAPALTANVVFLFTGYMRIYDLVVVLTSGGPAGATETIALQILRVGFQQNRMSYGSSLAIYMLLLVGVVSVTLVLLLRRREDKLVM